MPAAFASWSAELRAFGSFGLKTIALTPAAIRFRMSEAWPAASVLRCFTMSSETWPDAVGLRLGRADLLLAEAVADALAVRVPDLVHRRRCGRRGCRCGRRGCRCGRLDGRCGRGRGGGRRGRGRGAAGAGPDDDRDRGQCGHAPGKTGSLHETGLLHPPTGRSHLERRPSRVAASLSHDRRTTHLLVVRSHGRAAAHAPGS